MSIPKYDLETNLAILEAALAEFEAYVESPDLTRQLVVRGPAGTIMPNMTVGMLLDVVENIDREIIDSLPEQRIRLDDMEPRLETMKELHIGAYARKLRQELKSQLDSWAWFIQECREERWRCIDNYTSEVWIRTRIEDLLVEARRFEIMTRDEEDRLASLDEKLQRILQAAEYIGPPEERAARPAGQYWWLYGRPAPE